MIFTDTFSLPIGFTVVVQCKDGGPWMHGVVEEVKKLVNRDVPTLLD